MVAFSRGFVEQILHAIRPAEATAPPEVERITVHETVSWFSFLYERIRMAVDYKDEHLIRKAAILRILKRQLVLENDAEVIAERLVRELIGARYLPNNTLPPSLISEVAVPVKTFLAVARVNAGGDRHLEWLREIIAVEIEQILVDPTQEDSLIAFLYDRLADAVRVRGLEIDNTERRLQIYIACSRALLKADDAMLGFKLLRAYLPEWMRPGEWMDDPRPIAERLVGIERRIRERLNHPLTLRFQRAVKPWAVSLDVLREILIVNPERAAELLENPEELDKKMAQRIDERYAKAKTKLRRGTVRAIFYLFITKMLIALLIEAPVEWYLYDELNWRGLTVNLLFPPILMGLVGILIRVPGTGNTERLIAGVRELMGDAPMPAREIHAPKRRRGVSGFLFTLAYAATFLVSFGAVIWILHALEFTWISSAIFIFFLCVVSFFAFRLRQNARDMVVIEPRQSAIAAVADFFFLPILRAGRWLSRSVSRINIFLFIFDFLFEAPFKLFLTVLEEWFAFMKEKKDELQ